MIVTCPACETRYTVEDSDLGGDAGRRVRCASCGNVWHYSPEAEAIHAIVAEMAAEAEAAAVATGAPMPTAVPSQVSEPRHPEPRLDVSAHAAAPTAQSRPSVPVEFPSAWKPISRKAIAAGLVVLAAGLAVIAFLARDKIQASLPAMGSLFAVVQPAEPPGAGLQVTVAPSRTPESVVVNGDILNGASATRRIPRLRVTLHDGNKANLDSKLINPPVEQLPPGASAHFNTVFEHPNIAATGVDVSFTD